LLTAYPMLLYLIHGQAIRQVLLTKANTMTKLLNAYMTNKTEVTAKRLQAYLSKHMMAVCMASPEDIATLRAEGFKL